jgi:4-amino-4-deoxy-L-arabinose transferase-like glycosyltransferase
VFLRGIMAVTLNSPNPNSAIKPALVSQRAVQRLPRMALLLFCAAYVLPGWWGRDPWRNADLVAYGYMSAMAEGRTSWWQPLMAGLPLEGALLPHWLGAASIVVFGEMVGPAAAARLPFALMLALVLALTWYATFHLARTEAAQPVAFAFGGEAEPVDYARALADGALLALIGTLGLLQIGHETTPELSQLFAAGLVLWGMAAAPFRIWPARIALLLGLPLLAACGAPTTALLCGVLGVFITALSNYEGGRQLSPWVAVGTALAFVTGWALDTWAWRVAGDASRAWPALRLLLWFLWPTGLFALWTLWRWRRQLNKRHISVPLIWVAVTLVGSLLAGGSDRMLMVGLPAWAVLAAFALPTFRRSAGAAIDWFSVFFFSVAALAIWVIYAATITGVPAKTAANVLKLAPGYNAALSWPALLMAAAATVAWLALVRWRTRRQQHALWKSFVLPAGGVALAWLLLMTLFLPLLNYARSNNPWIAQLQPHIGAQDCVIAPDQTRAALASLEALGGWRAVREFHGNDCAVLLVQHERGTVVAAPPGWQVAATVRLPTDRREETIVLRRER